MSDNSAHLVIPLRVAELMCSRLCHDLISPVAAISNGLELLGDEADYMAGEITSLLSFSVGQAAGWLMFFRIAQAIRGLSIKPSLNASRTATSVNHDPPGTEMLVTPARRTFWAFHAARSVLSSGRNVLLPLASPGSLGLP